MSDLKHSILTYAQSIRQRQLLLLDDFLHLGTHLKVSECLSDLVAEGGIYQLDASTFVLPIHGRFGPRPPSIDTIFQALESLRSELFVAHGAAEASALGLTTQVPVREIYLTTGPSRFFQLGKRQVELKHGSKVEMLHGQRPAGKALRALIWLGPAQASEAIAILKGHLSSKEWDVLVQSSHTYPDWLAKSLAQIDC